MPELVTGTKQLARDKSQQDPPAKRNASCWGVVSMACKPPPLSATEALVGGSEGKQTSSLKNSSGGRQEGIICSFSKAGLFL